MQNDTISLPTHPGGENVTSLDSGENSANGNDPIVQAVRETTGREVKDRETALKVIKDNLSANGRLVQENSSLKNELEKLKNMTASSPEVAEKINQLEKRLNESAFYSENPDLKNYRDLISTYAGKYGGDLQKVLEDDSFKGILEKVQAAEKHEKSRSVLASNPRLGQATDKLTEAREAMKEGDMRKAGDSAVAAVLETLGSKNSS